MVIDNSTIHPAASAALAARLAARGIPMLDAPVAGSSGPARRREAPVMVGGDPDVFARCRPILDTLSIKGERMIEGNFEAEDKPVQRLKDVELMLEVGHAAGAPLLATALHQ